MNAHLVDMSESNPSEAFSVSGHMRSQNANKVGQTGSVVHKEFQLMFA